jgi:nicotinate-nucleotide adenylyltransferase
VFGGAFDPPHLAHRALAEAALKQLQLDVLHLLPTGFAWHKTRTLTPAPHRLALCQLAFDDLPGVRVDARELHRAGPSYTLDTLRELADEYRTHPGTRFFLVLGADQFRAFKTWQRWPTILEKATLAVAERLDAGDPPLPDQPDATLPFVRLRMPLHAVSATAVRAQLEDPTTASTFTATLAPAVAGYISQHHLYQPTS